MYKDGEKVCQANTNHEIAGIVILLLDIVYVRTRDITWDVEKNLIMIKRPITLEAIIVLNVSMPN